MLSINGNKIDTLVAINGSPIKGLLHVSVLSSNCYTADTFSATFATGSSPLSGSTFWASLSSAYIEIKVRTGSTSEVLPLITGMLDAMTLDPINGTVSVEGRDLSASLVDNISQQDFTNQTASEIVSAVALNHGLDAVVSSTSGSVGRYVADNYTKLSLGQFSRFRSDWDLVVELARENSYDIFVEDRTLYFQPATDFTLGSRRLYRSDYTNLRLERVLSTNAARSVCMQSWNCQNMSSYVNGNLPGMYEVDQASDILTSANYLFSLPNLTSQQVDQAAARYAREVERLRVVALIEGPWDLTLSPRTSLFLAETSSGLDGCYQIESIDRHYTSSSGSSQTIRAFYISE